MPRSKVSLSPQTFGGERENFTQVEKAAAFGECGRVTLAHGPSHPGWTKIAAGPSLLSAFQQGNRG